MRANEQITIEMIPLCDDSLLTVMSVINEHNMMTMALSEHDLRILIIDAEQALKQLKQE
jgi:hypothetical protein